MKKIIAVILAVCLIAVCCPAVFAEKEPALTFALASDLHYNAPREEITFVSEDDIFWYANRRCAMEDESGFIIDEFLRQCAENDDIRYVLISGDLADNGKSRPEDHKAVAEKLRAFEQATGKDVFVINGNHDAGNNCNTTLDDFKRIYADFGYDKALEKVDTDCSYTADLGEKYRLIALDSTDPDQSTADGMNAKKLSWVLRQADKAYADGRYPVVMMHHNLLDHMPLQRIFSHDFIVRFHYTTASLFADRGIKLVMTGHEHCSDVSSYTSAAGNVIYVLATTSLTMYPLQFRVMTLSEDRIEYETATVDKIDTGALTAATAGYTPEQIALMNAGLNDYAKGFLKQGIKYRLALSLTMEKMGISEDDFYYDLVNTAVGGLTSVLRQPLYGENSVSALAAEYGIDIPASDYKTGWDLATELVSYHYAGGESFELDSAEVTILLRTVALILRSDLAQVNDEVFLKAANELLGCDEGMTQAATKLCCSVFGGVKPGEYFIISLLSPLLYEFAVDADGVDDNNGAFDGYGCSSFENKMANIGENLRNAIHKLVKYMLCFMELFSRMFK